MNAPRPELTDLPGLPESLLPDALVATLPANGAEAPWECRCTGLLWLGRGGTAVSDPLPPELGVSRGLGVVGGFVRYADTPVGTYDEVFGIVGARDGRTAWGNVAFMSVDSPVSLVGGRTNWAMPKTLAEFDGSPETSMRATSTAGQPWRVTATPRILPGPALPIRSRAVARQAFGGGRVGASPLRFRGRVRPALVRVDVESDGPLATLLRPGRHLGAVVESATFSLGEPRFG